MSNWQEDAMRARARRIGPWIVGVLWALAAGCLLLAWVSARSIYCQLEWPRAEARVTRARRETDPNAWQGARDSCSVDVSWTDPSGKAHANTFDAELLYCTPGFSPSTITIVYDVSDPDRALLSRNTLYPAFTLALALFVAFVALRLVL